MDQSFGRHNSPRQAQALVELLKKSGHNIESEIHGVSMGDTLPDGSKIRIQPGPEAIVRGEIVAFLRGRTLVAHRVVYQGRGRLKDHLVTRGDARLLCDTPIRTRMVLGTVKAVGTDPGNSSPGVAVGEGRRSVVATLSLAFTVGTMYISVPLAVQATTWVRRLAELTVGLFKKKRVDT